MKVTPAEIGRLAAVLAAKREDFDLAQQRVNDQIVRRVQAELALRDAHRGLQVEQLNQLLESE